jgi:hypothetical protein
LNLEPEKLKQATEAIVDAIQRTIEYQQKLNPIQKERNKLDEEFRELQREIGIVSATAAERYRNAWQQAINDVQLRDIEAIERQIAAHAELGDKEVFHAEQARAAILDHMAGMKGYTDIVADAFISVSDKIGEGFSRLFGKVTDRMGAFGDIINDIATNLFKMVSNRLLMKLVDAILGPSPVTGGGSGGGGGIGSVIGGGLLNVFTGGRGGGIGTFINPTFPGGISLGGAAGVGNFGLGNNPAGNFFNLDGGSSITSFDTLSGQSADSRRLTQLTSLSGNVAQSGLSGLLRGGLSLGSVGSTLAPMLPFLGAGLGSVVGGGRGLSGILGGVGGALLGGAGAVGLLSASVPGIFAAGSAGLSLPFIGTIGASSGGALGGLSGIAGLLTNPITAVAAGALLVGAYFLNRNRQRREEEKVRDQARGDALAQLDEVIKRVRNHQLDPASGLAQAATIRANYMTEMSKLRDKKTRNHALESVRELDYRIGILRGVATNALNDNSRKNITAAFATGGVVPGQRGEPQLVLAHGGEIIASLANQTPELVSAAASAGIPGVAGDSGGGSGQNVSLNVELVVGTDTQNQMFVNGAKSEQGYKATVDTVRTAQSPRRRDL